MNASDSSEETNAYEFGTKFRAAPSIHPVPREIQTRHAVARGVEAVVARRPLVLDRW
jgi:hypothetical protein